MKLIWIMGLLITLCAIPSVEGREMVRVSESNNAGTVSLKIGDTLEVLLESNPSTGYQWLVDKLDTTMLKQGESAVIGSHDRLVGASGTEVLRFEAVATGQADLKLVYRRSFEKDVAPIKSYQLNVVVK